MFKVWYYPHPANIYRFYYWLSICKYLLGRIFIFISKSGDIIQGRSCLHGFSTKGKVLILRERERELKRWILLTIIISKLKLFWSTPFTHSSHCSYCQCSHFCTPCKYQKTKELLE